MIAILDYGSGNLRSAQRAFASTGEVVEVTSNRRVALEAAGQGAILREGIKVVIAGQPNAGKSSLLNALAGAELAIVTPIAGTTRDKVTQLIQIDGVPLHVVDTAGLREALDEVEKIGVERAWAEIYSADAVLFLHDLTQQDTGDYMANDDRIASVMALTLPVKTPIIDIWNKSDLASAAVQAHLGATGAAGVVISAKTGAGLQALREQLLSVVGWQSAPEGVFMARERHVRALAEVDVQLLRAAAQLRSTEPALDLLAEDLRQAQRHLGDITGQFTSDDLLGEIFSRFCIGK